MICDWCGYETPSYGDHFADPNFAGCRIAAQRGAFQAITKLDDPNVTPAQIRRRALRDLKRNRRRDRLEESGIATYARRDRRGRP